MVTPAIEGSGALGQFFLKCIGDNGETDDILLTSEGFKEGTT